MAPFLLYFPSLSLILGQEKMYQELQDTSLFLTVLSKNVA